MKKVRQRDIWHFCFNLLGFKLALPKLKVDRRWSVGINLFGFGVLVIGILLLAWSFAGGDVSGSGMALLIAGVVLQLLAVFTK